MEHSKYYNNTSTSENIHVMGAIRLNPLGLHYIAQQKSDLNIIGITLSDSASEDWVEITQETYEAA